MSEYNWCHGPNCHERQTTTKVLRTVKISPNRWIEGTRWEYFCDQTCMHDFINKHYLEFVRLHPRTECLETPVNVTKNDPDDYYYRTKIEVDESRQVG